MKRTELLHLPITGGQIYVNGYIFRCICGDLLVGPQTAKYCSDACRMRAKRLRDRTRSPTSHDLT